MDSMEGPTLASCPSRDPGICSIIRHITSCLRHAHSRTGSTGLALYHIIDRKFDFTSKKAASKCTV